MKKELKKVYKEFEDFFADKYSDYHNNTESNYFKFLIELKIRFKEDDIPFEDAEYFKDLFIECYNNKHFKNSFIWNSFKKDNLKELEKFYIEFNDEEDIIKTKTIKNLIFIFLILEGKTKIYDLFYMYVHDLSNLLIITEYLIAEFNNTKDIPNEFKNIIEGYIDNIISSKIYFKDDKAHLTYCLNFMCQIFKEKDINGYFKINAIEEIYRKNKNSLFSSRVLSIDKKKTDEMLNIFEDSKDIINKSLLLEEKLDEVDKDIKDIKHCYEKELNDLKNSNIEFDVNDIKELKNYYLIRENIEKDIKSIKHKKYDELCKLIKEKKNIVIVEEEGSNVETTIKQIEKELDIEIFKHNVNNLNEVLNENKEFYNSFIDAYINGKKLCIICDSNEKSFNTLFHSSGFFTEPTKYFIQHGSEHFKLVANKHPEFQIIIVVKEENIPDYELDMSKAEMAYHDYHDIQGFDKILFKEIDYPLMEYLYNNDYELFYLFNFMKKFICNLYNKDILKFLKYYKSGLFDLEQLFNILFSNIKEIDISYLEGVNTNNKYIKYLFSYLSENEKIKLNDKLKRKTKIFN